MENVGRLHLESLKYRVSIDNEEEKKKKEGKIVRRIGRKVAS